MDSANQWTGLYMITASAMKGLKTPIKCDDTFYTLPFAMSYNHRKIGYWLQTYTWYHNVLSGCWYSVGSSFRCFSMLFSKWYSRLAVLFSTNSCQKTACIPFFLLKCLSHWIIKWRNILMIRPFSFINFSNISLIIVKNNAQYEEFSAFDPFVTSSIISLNKKP